MCVYIYIHIYYTFCDASTGTGRNPGPGPTQHTTRKVQGKKSEADLTTLAAPEETLPKNEGPEPQAKCERENHWKKIWNKT